MNSGCQLLIVEADLIDELKRDPALVLGQILLAGRPTCHLQKDWRAISLQLSEHAATADFLFDGGVVLAEGNLATLFDPADARAFHDVLKPWNQETLYQRFRHDVMASSSIESTRRDNAGWSDSTSWDEERDDEEMDDLTIEQAEEFECLAIAIEALRAFVARAAAAGQGIVLIVFP